MTISLQDVFDSIYDDQGWTVISYLYSKIVLPEIKRHRTGQRKLSRQTCSENFRGIWYHLYMEAPMIAIEDVYTAINDEQHWATVAYLVEKIQFRGIYVNREAIKQLWLEQVEPHKKIEHRRLVPVVQPGDNVIDTRNQTKTPRQVLRDTEEGV